MKTASIIRSLILAGVLLAAPIGTQRAYAHCDGMDGPVVNAARQALETGDVNPVLVWVQSMDEVEVKEAFGKAQAVRRLNPQARELADLYFFETVVRIHRAGEGEPFTGLKPAGRDLGPAIPAADKAVESGSVDALVRMLADAAGRGIRERFERVAVQKKVAVDSVGAGREYVKTYVEFIHYVEGIHEAILPNGEHQNESRAVERQAAQ